MVGSPQILSTTVVQPLVNQNVAMIGATSGYRTGVVVDMNVRFVGHAGWGTFTLNNQVLTTIRAERGDSGSLIFRTSDVTTVGLLVGGAPGTNRTYHTRADLANSQMQTERH